MLRARASTWISILVIATATACRAEVAHDDDDERSTAPRPLASGLEPASGVASDPIGAITHCVGPSREACGNCGVRERACVVGLWTPWSACFDEGECAEGDVASCTGGGSKRCSSTCEWSPCGCANPPGEHEASITRACGACGVQSAVCRDGLWQWSPCTGEGVCTPRTSEYCAGGGAHSCTDACEWTPCSCASPDAPHGKAMTESCGYCGTRSVACVDGVWQRDACVDEGVCAASGFEGCGSSGWRVCGPTCEWRACIVPKGLGNGATHACALRANGNIVCWGTDYDGVMMPPAGPFTDFSTSAHACAVASNGTLVCWGHNSDGRADAPPGTFREVVTSYDRTCALRTDGIISCWGGSNWAGQNDAPAGVYSHIDVADNYGCALRTNHSITCWGFNGSGNATPPYGSFATVSTGHNHACALRDDGTAICWGYNGSGQTTVPLGSFSKLSAGLEYTCGVRTDGTLTCWGAELLGPEHPIHFPPAGTFTDVTTSRTNVFACARRTNGSVTCWGGNYEGQLDAPEGPL